MPFIVLICGFVCPLQHVKKPSCEPLLKPSCEPLLKPSCEPLLKPSCEPPLKPSCEPTWVQSLTFLMQILNPYLLFQLFHSLISFVSIWMVM